MRQPLSVGAGGFGPPTSRSRTVRSIRAEPRPAGIVLYHFWHFRQAVILAVFFRFVPFFKKQLKLGIPSQTHASRGFLNRTCSPELTFQQRRAEVYHCGSAVRAGARGLTGFQVQQQGFLLAL